MKYKINPNNSNPDEYYFEKNIMGDVVAIWNSNGSLQGRYTYDAWGNILSVTDAQGNDIDPSDKYSIMNLNSFRYRGYYYDKETNLYYLNSRYYDPETGRFINADEPSVLLETATMPFGVNLFAYCSDNPVMSVDLTGCAPQWLKGLGIGLAVVGTVLVIGAITVLTAGVGTTVLAGTLAGAVLHGAAVGALIGAGIGVVAGGIIGGAASDWSAEGILIGMGIGFGGGALIGAAIGGTVGGLQYGTFTSKSSLSTHLTRHGTKMGYANAKEYAKGAKYVIKNGTKVTYTYKGKLTTGFVRFLGQNGGANYAFVGMHGSRVATFGIRSVSELARLGISWLIV